MTEMVAVLLKHHRSKYQNYEMLKEAEIAGVLKVLKLVFLSIYNMF